MSALEDIAAGVLARGADYPAVEWQGKWISWAEMRVVADRVHALIEASGADPQAPVALIPRNLPATLAALLGLIAGRRHIRMIHVYQSPAGIARDIERLRPAVVVVSEQDVSDHVVAILRDRGIAGIALGGMEARAIPGCERSTARYDPPPAEPQIDLLTSGTTGPPKQFPLSYDLIARDMVGMNVMGDGKAEARNAMPMLLFFPFGNFSGLYSNLAPVLQGIRGVLVDRFTLPAWRDFIARHRPEWAGVPPAGITMIMEADVPPAELACLRYVRVGSAPIDPDIHRGFEERYGIPIVMAYGATEMGGPVTSMTYELAMKWGAAKRGSVGPAIPGAQLRVIDAETGDILPPGREGVLEVVSSRMGPDWIRTSDLAIVDEDGFLFFRGRADGAIMRGGFKMLPHIIEQALMRHEAVSAVGVTGIADKRLGQVPAAAIKLKPHAKQPSTAEMEAHMRALVEAPQIPASWRFVDELPYNGMMKVDRVALRQLFDA